MFHYEAGVEFSHTTFPGWPWLTWESLTLTSDSIWNKDEAICTSGYALLPILLIKEKNLMCWRKKQSHSWWSFPISKVDEAQLKSRHIFSSEAQLLLTAFPQHSSCKIHPKANHLGLLLWKYICRTAVKVRNEFLNSVEFINIKVVCTTKYVVRTQTFSPHQK